LRRNRRNALLTEAVAGEGIEESSRRAGISSRKN
jgi:hypothetical protein